MNETIDSEDAGMVISQCSQRGAASDYLEQGRTLLSSCRSAVNSWSLLTQSLSS
jgi:hypothetical protein